MVSAAGKVDRRGMHAQVRIYILTMVIEEITGFERAHLTYASKGTNKNFIYQNLLIHTLKTQ